MGINVGGNIKNENLVFGYDTGFGVVDNHLTTLHYKGEPTTNLATLDLSNSSVWYNESPSVTTKVLMDETLFGYPVYKFKSNPSQIWVSPFAFNGFDRTLGDITLSAYIKNVGGSGNVNTFLGGDFGTDSLGVPNAQTIPTDGVWRRYSWTRYSAAMTSNQLEWRTHGDGMLISCPQVEYKSHATPIVEGTRSVTESLYDLSGNHTIDMTNMAYDSTGQPIQNYSSTYITPVNTRTIDFGGGISVDIWYKNGGGTGNYRGVINNGDSTFRFGGFDIRLGREDYYGGGNNGSSLNGRITTTSEDLTYSSSTSVYANPNEWHNYTLTYDNYTIRWYKDGEFWGSLNHTAPGPIVVTGNDFTIGVSPGTSEYLDGQLASVKVYDLQLSAEEVQQNYNSTKGRFGL